MAYQTLADEREQRLSAPFMIPHLDPELVPRAGRELDTRATVEHTVQRARG